MSGNQVVHLDLFSGIGGFAYAIDQVWDNVTHIFCDNEPFAQKVLAKHWPESEIYSDIKEITADTFNTGLERGGQKAEGHTGQPSGKRPYQALRPFILTGGFPCQPFSSAGLRRGTADDRFLWPEMLRVIRLTQPTWVIAENVRGLLTLEHGLVFEQVCADLEASGYEVQPFIIPAVAVNAPHRRDRVWFVANTRGGGQLGQKTSDEQSRRAEVVGASKNGEYRSKGLAKGIISHAKHDGRNGSKNPQGSKAGDDGNTERPEQVRKPKGTGTLRFDTASWEADWLEVATFASRMDDGLPDRSHRLKALGNAIVPQVAEQLIRGIDLVSYGSKPPKTHTKSAQSTPAGISKEGGTDE